jgi:hypothetical protein
MTPAARRGDFEGWRSPLKRQRYRWTKDDNDTSNPKPERNSICLQCGLRRRSSGYDLQRWYVWDGPPRLYWEERAPACPPDLATGRDIVKEMRAKTLA